ncbi:unnamed protein product [Nippostrongylus brasiliensis]|uniref:Lipoprotein n=1 Tax=Nippostrongylus brasiliensis TaxID=27835 RepID=A0A0N4YIA4_NIPBR|nr:unnamed protein product [Nippostrongylus brasiliensis]
MSSSFRENGSADKIVATAPHRMGSDVRRPAPMARLLTSVLVLAGCAVSMPPPVGLNLKPAKAVGEQQPSVPLEIAPSEVSKEPPNLRLRSRMMAALNTVNDTNRKELLPGTQTLILTKNRKYKKLPSSANYGVNPVLQTNFVDAHGRVLKNVRWFGDARILSTGHPLPGKAVFFRDESIDTNHGSWKE